MCFPNLFCLLQTFEYAVRHDTCVAHSTLKSIPQFTIWARFTNSLHQHKPSFGVKIVLSGFTKDAQWAEKVWTVIFAPDLI